MYSTIGYIVVYEICFIDGTVDFFVCRESKISNGVLSLFMSSTLDSEGNNISNTIIFPLTRISKYTHIIRKFLMKDKE